MSEPKVALVTGSSSGIGEATVKMLTLKGYKVAVVGSKQEKVERVARECATLSPLKFQPLTLVLDFNLPDNGKVAVERTIEHFGRLDVLVNNAGIWAKTPGYDPNTYKVYREIMTINTDATVCATLAAVEELKRTKGNLIFVSSVASVKPADHGYAYCMSKASMSIFAKCLAIDLAPDVRVNTVSPGPVITPIFERIGLNVDTAKAMLGCTTLTGRAGASEEIAASIAYLISDDAAFVYGHELFIDGGYLLKPSNFNVAQQALARKKTEEA